MQTNLYPIEGDYATIHNSRYTQEAVTRLESGQVIYCHQLEFALSCEELVLLTPDLCDTRKKNISYDYNKQRLSGLSKHNPYAPQVQMMMHRYAQFSKILVDTVLPDYHDKIQWGRTSFRPTEIEGRKRSKRQDDTRVHVDAFPATPVQGLRILRVFCNINPEGKPRVWHLGEPFEKVLHQFAPKVRRYSPFKAKLLRAFKATKTLRSRYDHYMLSLHDSMKLDDTYQNQAPKEQIDFPPKSTWIVFTDLVSHAALSGQYLLEQTFYLPVEGMNRPELSPLRVIEGLRHASLPC